MEDGRKVYKITFSELEQRLLAIPASLNYLDTLKQSTKEYLSKYLFFKINSNEVFSLSSDGNLHYYGGKADVLTEIFNFLDSENLSIKMIFTNSTEEIDALIKLHFDFAPKPYIYMQADGTIQGSTNLSLREATLADQNAVNLWYEKFNTETKSSWPTPVISSDESNLYLIYRDDQFIGGVANTLQSNERFWIGRMWINPTERKAGIGSSLIQEMLRKASEHNKKLSLLVSPDNNIAIRIYERFGFKVIAKNTIWFKPDSKLITKDTI